MGGSRPFGNIRKLPSGRYQARYWHLGKQVPADTTFATKADARAWLATIETDLLSGRHVDPSSGRERFGCVRRALARGPWPSAANSGHIRIAARPHPRRVRDGRAAQDNTGIGSAWHGRLSKSGLHANTVAKVYRLFRTMLETAVDDGLLRTNPVHIKGAAVERSIERPMLSWDDIERIADAIHPRFRALVWVGATSGLRYGELTGLTRRHVDLEDRSLRVDQALSFVKGQGPTLGPPKSAAAHRTVVMPIGVAEMLAAHIDEYVNDDPDALVFTSVKDSPLVNRYFAPYWKKALKAADLDELIRFHDLRHHAGTSAATAGASLREIMARMGHASSDASLRYLKASTRRDEEIADAMQERMIGDLGG